jgi:hypothetical protein
MANGPKRELDNWLEGFLDWTRPRSEAPEALLKWAGLFTLSSVLKRRVYWPRRLLGTYEIDMHLYVMFVGPPGVVKKSTTIGYALDLLRQVSSVTIGSGEASTSALVKQMIDAPDHAIRS